MATFEAQVEGLTGLSIDGSSSPTQTELSQFLKDGVVDVINKLVKTDKAAAMTLGTITTENGSGTIIDGDIIDVWGSDGTNDHPAQLVPSSVGKRAVDTSSLLYRSKYNPYYYREGKRVIVKPDGGSVLHVTYPSVAYDQETIYNVPNQYISLIMIYASIKSLGNALSAKSKTDLSINALVPVPPNLSDSSITLPTNIPLFSAPTSAMTYTNIDTYIDTEEDIELAGSKMQEMNLKLQEYQANIQKNLNTFNASNAQYQAGIQKALQEGQLKSQDDVQKVQKYSAELQRYTGEVQKEVQEWTTNFSKLQADYQWMQGRQQGLLQEYYSAFTQGQPAPQQEARRRYLLLCLYITIAADADADAIDAIHHDIKGSLGGELTFTAADADDRWFYAPNVICTTTNEELFADDTNATDLAGASGDQVNGPNEAIGAASTFTDGVVADTDADKVWFLFVKNTGTSDVAGTVSTNSVYLSFDGTEAGYNVADNIEIKAGEAWMSNLAGPMMDDIHVMTGQARGAGTGADVRCTVAAIIENTTA